MSDDNISHPPHYVAPNGMEAIDVIESFGLGFALGNAIKYILRAGKKGERTEDLKKARWYLEREIGDAGLDFERGDSLRWKAASDAWEAEVLHLRALIAEHTEDETCWRDIAEVSSERLQAWREWAQDLTPSLFVTPIGMILPDARMREIIGYVTRRQAPKPKRKAKK